MPSEPRTGQLAGLSILVVEDEMLLAMDYEAILRRQGGVVIGPAPREAKAFALLESTAPDAVLLDLNLNGERPVRLAETLIARGVPFLIVTGYSALQIDEAAFRVAPRLDKPVNAAELIDAILDVVRTGVGPTPAERATPPRDGSPADGSAPEADEQAKGSATGDSA